VGREEEKHFGLVYFIVYVFITEFRYQHLKSSLLHLIGQPYCKKSRSAKVKDGIINLILRNYLID